MADEPKATTVVESETQLESKPDSEQKIPSHEEAEETPLPDIESEETDEGRELPEGAKERTRQQFEKLKSDYRKERARRLKLEQSMNQFQTSPQPQPETEDWYDEETGTVKVDKLRAREKAQADRIARLEQQVQGVSGQNQAQQEKELYVAYPELNPDGDRFNEDFYKVVRRTLTAAYIDGETPHPKEIADAIMGIAGRKTKQAEEEGAKKALEQLSPKEQAALEATGRSDRRLPVKDLESLSRATRKGGDASYAAIIERMKGTPAGK